MSENILERDAQKLIDIALKAGFFRAGLVPVDKIPFEREFRKACECNACGNFGKCWTCPPDVGDIDALISIAKGYDYALVYQSVAGLEDSYDIEGMMEAGNKHNEMTKVLISQTEPFWRGDHLHLSAGGCRLCERCAKRDEEPCRHPESALASLEAYGVAVSRLAELAGMKYINGVDTVTYFGACLFHGINE